MQLTSKLFIRQLAVISIFSFLFATCSKKDAIIPEIPEPPVLPVITSVLEPVTFPVSSIVGGYYVGLPSNYAASTEKYPLLVYIPGAGQFGNGSIDLPTLLKDGPAQLIDEKRFPGVVSSGGKNYSFVVFTPQFKSYPSPWEVKECIEFAISKYRVDTSRIYLSGLSIGGVLSCDVAALIPTRIAAIVPMAGVAFDYATTNKCERIAVNKVPAWVFHSADDPLFRITEVEAFIAKVNSFNPAIPPKLTIWPNGGHDAWTKALEPSYKMNGMNIYEWMLQYRR